MAPSTNPAPLSAAGGGGELAQLALGLIVRDPDQPRRRFDQQRLVALAESMSASGPIAPVIVRPLGEHYQLIAGERRWRAAYLAGLSHIPAVIYRQLDDRAAYEIAVVDNMVREDLTPVEEARSIAVLCDRSGLGKAEIARRVGRSRESISNLVRLLDLPEVVLELIDGGQLSEGHGKALLGYPDHGGRSVLARRAVAERWTVRETERQVRQILRPTEASGPQRPESHPDRAEVAGELEELLAGALGREVEIAPQSRGYRVSVSVEGPEDAEALLARAAWQR